MIESRVIIEWQPHPLWEFINSYANLSTQNNTLNIIFKLEHNKN